MRMNDAIRVEIVRAVMADVPAIAYDVKMRDAALKAAVDALPPEARKLWDNPDTRGWINMRPYYNCCMSFVLPVKLSERPFWENQDGHVAFQDPEYLRLHKLHDEQEAARDAARTQITQAVKTCTSVKQFIERYPELAKYAPEGARQKQQNALASTELMDSLKTAGLKTDTE